MLPAPDNAAAPELATTERDATDVRFSMRSLLIAMAIVAVAVAAFGAFLRRFPADQQVRVLIYTGIVMVLGAALLIRRACRRYLAEVAAGNVLFRLLPHSYFLPQAPSLLAIALGIAAIAAGGFMWLSFVLIAAPFAFIEAWDQLGWEQFLYAVVGIAYLVGGVTYLWWDRRYRVCDRGMVIAQHFIPWTACKRWYWDACYRDVLVTEWSSSARRVAVRVPPAERAAVEAILREKVAR